MEFFQTYAEQLLSVNSLYLHPCGLECILEKSFPASMLIRREDITVTTSILKPSLHFVEVPTLHLVIYNFPLMPQLPSISNFHSPNGVDQKQMAYIPDQSDGLL